MLWVPSGWSPGMLWSITRARDRLTAERGGGPGVSSATGEKPCLGDTGFYQARFL